MEKLSSCVFLLVAIFLVQNVALAVWPTLSFCGRDEPSEDRDSNNTVNLTMDDENYCIPTDIPKLNAKSTYYLRSRERFYVNISGVFGGSGAVEVEAVQQQADVGVLRNSCILAEDDKYFVKFFIDEDAVIAPENRLFYLNIGTVERRFLFQFYPTGLNLADQRPLQTTYTVDELPLPILSVLVLSEDNKTVSIFDYKVCKVEGNTYTLIEGSLVFDTTSLEGICNTFDLDEGLLRAGNLKLSPKGDLVDLLFEDSPSIRIVAVPGNCNDSELQDSAQVITIARFATTSSTTMQTPTPTSGGTDSTNTPTGNGGLSAGAIAGIVIASTIIGVGFLVAVILAAVILVLKRPEWFKTIRRPPTETVLSHVSPSDPEAAVEQPKDTTEEIDDTKRILVLNLWPDGDELEDLLYDGNPGTIPESAKKNAHQLTALIMKDNCQFFYLVRHVSREELRTANETAWELLRDFNTRFFPSKVLQKFIDVWVFDENKVVGGFPELVLGPILTVNVSLNKWRGNMKGCAQLVRSKARTNIDSPDGMFSASHTPSATESPPRLSSVLTNSDQNHTTGRVMEAAEVQTAAAPELRQSPGPHPPLYQQPRNQDSSQTPHQQSPQPPEQLPPPYNNGTHPETDTGGFLKEILYVLKDIRTSGGRTATAAEQSAQNTSLMRERQGETLALTEEIHDTVTAPPEDTHEAT